MTNDPVERLEHDHLHLSRLVDGLRESTQATLRGETDPLDLREELTEFLRAAGDELYEHFDREESALFPFMVEAVPELEATVGRLEAAHDRMCGILGRLERAVTEDDDAFTRDLDTVISLFARFDANFVQHAREERDLLRTLGERLDADQRRAVAELMRQL